MKLVMTLLVRNEEDILRENIEFHLEQGVDHFIITDNLSSDGTQDIIKEYVARGLATLIVEPDHTFDQDKWVTRMARMAKTEFGATWVINNDADEFWMPTKPGRTLKDALKREVFANVIVADRHNFVLPLDVDGPFWRRMAYRWAASKNAAGRPLPSKVLHRGNAQVDVGRGAHKVSGFRWLRKKTGDFEILHFPMRGRQEYIERVSRSVRALERNKTAPATAAPAIRLQYAELKETGKISYLEDHLVTETEIPDLVRSGTLVRDDRLLSFFMRREGSVAKVARTRPEPARLGGLANSSPHA